MLEVGDLGRLVVRRRRLSLSLVLTVFAVYSFAVWLYAVALQITLPQSTRWPLCRWIPLDIGTLGEISFATSLACATLAALTHTKQGE
jgi:hypothetical protein